MPMTTPWRLSLTQLPLLTCLLGILLGSLVPATVQAQDLVRDALQQEFDGNDFSQLPKLKLQRITSSLDQTEQPTFYWAPSTAKDSPTPVLLMLHSWSGNYKQNNQKWQKEAVERGWIFLHPDFRGPNNQPDACGSRLARQDVLDCLDWATETFQVDPERIYLAGASGGGHMALLMAGHHPERFSAVSAWVGITDLAEWYRFHSRGGIERNYAQMIVNSLGGPPGTSPEVDAQYRERSPIFHLKNAKGLPVEVNAGIHDGYSGSVPVDHTLRAFNELARANNGPSIPETEIQRLVAQGKGPSQLEGKPLDPRFGRVIHYTRQAGPARVTLFEGGHEGLADAACAWLSTRTRLTTTGIPQP